LFLFILIDGVTYVRWGRKGCPNGADIVYTGDQFYFNGPFILPITLKHDVARKSHNCCLKIQALSKINWY